MFAVELAMIAGENDDGFVQRALLLKHIDNCRHAFVNPEHHLHAIANIFGIVFLYMLRMNWELRKEQ